MCWVRTTDPPVFCFGPMVSCSSDAKAVKLANTSVSVIPSIAIYIVIVITPVALVIFIYTNLLVIRWIIPLAIVSSLAILMFINT